VAAADPSGSEADLEHIDRIMAGSVPLSDLPGDDAGMSRRARRTRIRGDKRRLAAKSTRSAGSAAVVVAALGVVFGDIGTSPIYTIQTAFNPGDPHPIQTSLQSVYGVVSLIFWAVVLIVTVKYVGLVMKADNDGEGGIMALISQIRQIGEGVPARIKFLLAGLGVFGAALFFGDSMITPAISVLSAVQGTETVSSSMASLVIPITVTIIVVLFAIQHRGTGSVGRMFGPIMLVWFATIGALGIRGIAMHPEVLKALSPGYAFDFLFHSGSTGFFSLASVVLAITGVEALYADMGHFGRPAITRGWLLLVFPACILSYLGQGALILDDPSAISAPFFRLMPHAGLVPLVVLATAATVIASQAVISGAFSMAHQAAQLDYLPHLRVIHTSGREYGQVYVPVINWVLMGAVVALVLAFQSSAKLAFAFGMAVTGTIAITTILFFVIVHRRWQRPLWLAILGAGLFLAVELAFFGANVTKFLHGAWVPLLIGVLLFTVMTTWFRGRQLVGAERRRVEGPLQPFVDELRRMDPPLIRSPGTGVFLSRGKETVPLSMRACVDHLHSLQEHAIILSLQTLATPQISAADRLEIDDLRYRGDGVTFVSAKHGYAEHYDVPALVRQVVEAGVETPIDTRDASFYLSEVELKVGNGPGMRRWRKRLFLVTGLIASDPADYFGLPRERTITIGSEIEF
jgi:KUP system potassium uptake protein